MRASDQGNNERWLRLSKKLAIFKKGLHGAWMALRRLFLGMWRVARIMVRISCIEYVIVQV